MAVFFALLTLFGWGLTDLFGAISSRKLGHINAFFWMMVIAFVIASFYVPFAGPILNLQMFLATLVLNVFLLYSDILYFRALEIGNASLVAAIAGSFGFVSALISIIFFHETLNALQMLGVFLATAGVVLSSFDFREVKTKGWKKLLPEDSVKYALIALFGWGIYYGIVRIPVASIGWFWTEYSWNFLFVLLIITGKVKAESIKIFKDKKQFLPVLLFAVFMVIGVFSYNLGLSFGGYTSVMAPIAASSTTLFVILTRIFFKEPLTRQQKAGIISSLLGIALISFNTSA